MLVPFVMPQSDDEQKEVDYEEEEHEPFGSPDSPYVESTDSDDPTDPGTVRYISDTLSYDGESRLTDTSGKIILDHHNKSMLVSDLPIDGALKLFDTWLKATPFLPPHVRTCFDTTNVDWQRREAFLNKNREISRLSDLMAFVESSDKISRKCIVHFFGDMNRAKFSQHTELQILTLAKFLDASRSKHEREMILFALSVHAYLREARQDPTSSIAMNWEYHMLNAPPKPISDKTRKEVTEFRYDQLDVTALAQHRYKPFWAVLAVVAWVSFDRTKINKLRKRPNLPPPPKSITELERFWHRICSGNLKVNGAQLWRANHGEDEPIPEDVHTRMPFKHSFICYDPYYQDWHWELGSLRDIVKLQWNLYGDLNCHMVVLVCALEDEISNFRMTGSKFGIRMFPDVADDIITMNDWGLTYHLHHPFAWKRLDNDMLINSPYNDVVTYFANSVYTDLRNPHPTFNYRAYLTEPDLRGLKDSNTQQAQAEVRQKQRDDLRARQSLPPRKGTTVPPPVTPAGNQGTIASAMAGRSSPPPPVLGSSNRKMTADELAKYWQDKFEQSERDLDLFRKSTSSSSSSTPGMGGAHPAQIISVGDEKRLVAPKRGTTWESIDSIALLEAFKLNIETMKQQNDLTYRENHMDQAWISRLDMTFFHSQWSTINWRRLDHEKFFYEATRIYGKLKVGPSAFYTADALYSQQFIELLGSTFTKGKHLWTGNFEKDRSAIELLMSNLGLLQVNYPPQPHEVLPDKLEKQVADFRAKWHGAALAAYNKSNLNTCRHPEVAFMVQVDASTRHPRADVNNMDTFNYRHPAELLTTDHTAGNYHSRFPISRGIYLNDYLRVILLVAMQIETRIMRPALAVGMRIGGDWDEKPDPTTDGSVRQPRENRENTRGGRGGRGGRGDTKGGGRDQGRGGRGRGRGTPKTDPPQSGQKLCYVCGKDHPGDCMLRDHPDANLNPRIPWTDSKYGKIYGQRIPPITKLPNRGSIADPNWQNPNPPPNDPSRGQTGDRKVGSKHKKSQDPKPKDKDKKSSTRPPSPAGSESPRSKRKRREEEEETEVEECELQPPSSTLCTTLNTQHDYLLTCSLSIPSHDLNRKITCMIDTGALDDNYVSAEIGNFLKENGAIATKCVADKICSCSKSMCFDCLGVVQLEVKFHNELINDFETISLKATIMISDFDLIIGRRDIFKYDLIRKAYKQIFADLLRPSKSNAFSDSQEHQEARVNQLMNAPFRSDASRDSTTHSAVERGNTTHSVIDKTYVSHLGDRDIPETSGSPRSRCALIRMDETQHLPPEVIEANRVPDGRIVRHRSELISGSHEYFEDPELEDQENDWDPMTGNVDPKKTYQVYGPPSLQAKLRKLLSEYNDVFSDKLSPEAARVQPMTLDVIEEKWMTKSNRLAPRATSTSKQEEIGKQIGQMLEQGLIRPSKATAWSQVLMVPKPNNQWRFCVDFRRLNDATKAEGWPIPNIKETLNRIGRAKGKFFATMDLTKGFYQAPLSEASKKYTAFTCFMGLYEWNRVPMGLKGAPSFYQMALAMFVFVGLISIIMELYIDDLIIHGKTEDEFISRLRQVFGRMREFKLTVNPAKCKFGISEVDYVGHVIDPTGLTFSQDKKDKVRDFPKPTTSKHVKSFLGLANYFRDHVHGYSEIAKPLQDMIVSYERSKKVIWTPQAEQSFTKMKDAIVNSAKLYFVDDDIERNPVFLETDASDYGIGAYLYQVKDGKEYPLQFLSKALNATQLKWATGEKEAYAIFFSIKKLKVLLRDIFFTLRTDHMNLTYINDSASPKVNRWKLELMEYNFDVVHIPGVKNIVADSFSRLLTLEGNSKIEGYEDLKASPAFVLAVLAVPEKGKLSPFKTPSKLYKLIASKCHNGVVGHFGVDLTYERTKKELALLGDKFPNLRAHVQNFVQKCPCCQKMSHIRTPILTQKFSTSTYTSMERIYIDTIGPLPTDKYGMTYIATIIDGFTRWVELYALPDATAETAARLGLLDWVGRFGVPLQIMTDGGTQFANELWDQLSILMGTEKLESFPYSHEENGLVERANKEVMRHLRNFLFDSKLQYSDWSTFLPMVQRIMNGHPIGATKITPAQLLFGNAVSLNDRILPKPNTYRESKPLSVVTADMLAMQQHLISIHLKLLKEKDNMHLATPYDTRKKIDQFPIGSFVLVEYNDSSLKGRGPPHKLMPFKRGPYKVVNNIGTRYTLLDLITNKYEDVLLHRLHPFLYDQENLDPKEVAMRDKEEYVIEKILDHDGTPDLKSSMKFLVKWKGYSAKHNTWEPWKSVRLVDKLHDYLKAKGMKNLIPKECLQEQTPEPSRHTKKKVRIDLSHNEIMYIEPNIKDTQRRSKRLRK